MEIFTKLITPFNEDGTIDYHSLNLLINKHLHQGNNCFVIGSLTGEGMLLNLIEFRQLVNYLCCNHKIKIFAYILSESTKKAIEQINELNQIKQLAGFIIKLPSQVKYSQTSIYKHLHLVSVVTNKKIIIDQGNQEISITVIDKLLEKHKNFIGLITNQTNYKLRKNFKCYINDYDLFTGIDDYDGIMSDLCNLDYLMFTKLLNSDAKIIQDYFKLVIKYLYADNITSVMKYILAKKGYIIYKLRLPLVKINDDLKKELNKLMEKY